MWLCGAHSPSIRRFHCTYPCLEKRTLVIEKPNDRWLQRAVSYNWKWMAWPLGRLYTSLYQNMIVGGRVRVKYWILWYHVYSSMSS